MRTLVYDTECFRGFWLAAFKDVATGQVVTFEKSRRAELDRARLHRVFTRNRIVGFNSLGYDAPMVALALSSAGNAELKSASDRIIKGGLRWWEVENALNVVVPRLDHIDLIEPQPNAFASLKTLNGRLHGRRLQDLPFDPDADLSEAEMDIVAAYCVNDLEATQLLLEALAEPLAMREALGADYRQDFRSKSDSQIGEAIVRRRVEEMSGSRVERVHTPPGTSFRYAVPDFIRFETPALQQVLEDIRRTDFVIKPDGGVDMPKSLADLKLTIGGSTYAMGIGGLHSTEANRAVRSDDERVLIDADVASQYPSIILKLGLFPKALGPHFLSVYAKIKADRLAAKRAKDKVRDKGMKIALNGVYGKLGSKYSILYAPHLMIAVTLTGQLTLLMLIERAEAAGISVVSGNTDGVLFHCPRRLQAGIEKDRLLPSALADVTAAWERDTGFDLEFAEYRAIYNQSVNSYIAVKADGKVKQKGPVANPWGPDGDLRERLMKNPQMTVLADALMAFVTEGLPLEQTIRACRDVRGFVTVIKASKGATWRGEYLGKVVRFIWSTAGEPILRADAHPKTGNHAKVPKTDGCRPVMELPDELPADIDYARYIAEAEKLLVEIGAVSALPPPVRIRADRPALLAWALAA